MTTMERHGSSTLSKKNTFQLMLDLEKESKLNRLPMEKPTNVMSQSRVNCRPRSVASPHPQPTRAATPKLSVSIPRTDMTKAMPPLVDDNGALSSLKQSPNKPEDGDSDESSICHSPGWDDAETKRQRKLKYEAKDKRRKEKEKAMKETRKAEHTMKKLIKPPPNRLSKTAIRADRSNSIPYISSSSTTGRGMETVPGVIESRVATESDTSLRDPKRVPGVSDSSQSHFHRLAPSRVSDGFIGGLKLKMADQAALEDSTKDGSSTIVQNSYTSSGGKATQPGKPQPLETEAYPYDGRYSNTPIEKTLQPPNLDPPKPAFGLPTSSSPRPLTPIMDRNIKRKRKDKHLVQEAQSHSDPQVDPITVPREHPLQSNPTGFNPPILKSQIAEPRMRNRLTRPRNRSPDRPPVSYREPLSLATEPSRGRDRSGSYVANHRQQSRDRSVSGFEDENRVSLGAASDKSHSRGRSWSIASLTRRPWRSSSKQRSEAGSDETVKASDGDIHRASAIDKCAAGSNDSSDIASIPGLRASLESPTTSTFKGFKNIAKSAFSRHSYAPPSPSSPAPVLPELFKEPFPVLSRKSSDMSSHTFGRDADVIPKSTVDHPRPTNLPQASEQVLMNQDLPRPRYPKRSSSRMPRFGPDSPSSTNTDSSDNVQDETTAPSSPTASRPQSEKGLRRRQGPRRDSNGRAIPFGNSGTQHLMGASLPVYDDGEIHETWNKSSNQSHSNSNEGSSTANKSLPKLPLLKPFRKGSLKNRSSKEETHTRQQGQLPTSKFNSSSDLEISKSDLEPKHQAPPSSDKGKGKERRTTTPPKSPRRPKPKKPLNPAYPLPLTKPNTTSINPTPSAHLQAARLALPKPILSGPPTASSINPPPDSIAKMLVVCCSCRYFHDMPSKIYACMAQPDDLIEDKELGVSGLVSTAVKCPWCAHGMSVRCCEGWAAVVVLRERLH